MLTLDGLDAKYRIKTQHCKGIGRIFLGEEALVVDPYDSGAPLFWISPDLCPEYGCWPLHLYPILKARSSSSASGEVKPGTVGGRVMDMVARVQR